MVGTIVAIFLKDVAGGLKNYIDTQWEIQEGDAKPPKQDEQPPKEAHQTHDCREEA